MTLRTKLLGSTVVLVIVLGAFLIFLLRGTLAARLETELQQRGISIAKFVAVDSTKLILTENTIALLLLLESSRQVEDDIAYVFIEDPEGKVLVHTYGDSFPTGLLRANAPGRDGSPSVRKLDTGLGTIYDIAVRVGDADQLTNLGTVRVGILGKSIDEGVAAVLYNGAGITVACLLLFGAAALWVDLAITRNIENLSAGTKALGTGDLAYRIPVTGGGEFAELAIAFNTMAENLERSEEKQVDLNSMLVRENRDRTLAERNLRISLERYGALFKSVSDGIYVHEPTPDSRFGRIVEVNDTGCIRLGYTREELLGMTFDQIGGPETDAAGSAAIVQRLRAGETVVFEFVHCAKDGRCIPIEVSSRVFDLEGTPMALSICRDATERKRFENELRHANAELARQNEELVKLDRLREGFVRDVSHELKTPVAKYAMQLEILRGIAEREGFAPKIAKVVTVMDSSVSRQQKVIRNLLGLARLESGVRGYRCEPVQLEQLLGGVIDDYQPELSARGIVLDVRLEQLAISSDAEMLWHVFSNLLNNAIKFQKSPVSGRIGVSLVTEGQMAVVRVRDDGIGLTTDELNKVFDKFYQVTASAEGSGVGLTICRMIVEGVGGSIGFESSGRGTGTTAVVRLPVVGGVKQA